MFNAFRTLLLVVKSWTYFSDQWTHVLGNCFDECHGHGLIDVVRMFTPVCYAVYKSSQSKDARCSNLDVESTRSIECPSVNCLSLHYFGYRILQETVQLLMSSVPDSAPSGLVVIVPESREAQTEPLSQLWIRIAQLFQANGNEASLQRDFLPLREIVHDARQSERRVNAVFALKSHHMYTNVEFDTKCKSIKRSSPISTSPGGTTKSICDRCLAPNPLGRSA